MRRGGAVAVAAAAGGSLWVVKAGAILAGASQPEHAFEFAPVAFAVAALLVALELPDRELRRGPVIVAVVAVAASLLSLGWYLVTGAVLGVASLAGLLATLVALGLAGRRLRRAAADRDGAVTWLAVAIAVATVPAVVAGGALSLLDERLLELPILVVGLAWVALAWAAATARRRGGVAAA